MDKSYLLSKDEINAKIFIDRNFFKELIISANVESSLLIDYIMKETSRIVNIHIDHIKLREILMFGSHRINDDSDSKFQNNISRIPQNSSNFAPIIDFKMPNKPVGHGYRESGVDNIFMAETIYRIDGPIKADISIFITGDSDLIMLPNYVSNKTVPILVRFNLPDISRYTSTELSRNFTYVINAFEDIKRFRYAFDGKIKSGQIITVQANTAFVSSPEKLAFNTKLDSQTGKNIETPNFYFFKENTLLDSTENKQLTELINRQDEVYFKIKYLYNVKTQAYNFCAYDVTKDKNAIE